MGNACKPFGFNVDEGMRAFTVVEMFMGVYHIVVAHGTHQDFLDDNIYGYGLTSAKEKGALLTFIMVLLYLLMAFLIIQAVLGLLLFFCGYRKSNVTICLIWIIAACINFTLPWFIFACHFGLKPEDGDPYDALTKKAKFLFWKPYYLYLFYLIFGVWIVISYMKWAKATGIAVQFSVAPVANKSNAPASPQEPAGHLELDPEQSYLKFESGGGEGQGAPISQGLEPASVGSSEMLV